MNDLGTEDTVGDPKSGLLAGRYRLEEQIGRGGMGAVFRAFDSELNEVIALKTLTIEDEPMAVERFRREVKLARRITHRSVARTFDLGSADGKYFLTMEWINGETLSKAVSKGALPLSESLRILADVGAALSAAHEVGVIHRDLKPSNIMLETNERGDERRVVITDFGIAKAASGENTLTAGPIGTPEYMAPEQVSGGDTDARTDLYALGGLAFYLLAGRPPFGGKTPIAVAMERLLSDPPAMADVCDLPSDLCTLVDQCLARDPAGRPKNATDVCERLATIRSQIGNSGEHAVRSQPELSSPAVNDGPSDATQVTQDRGLVVLPFLYRGPSEQNYLAESLTDELTDLLVQTRGLRLYASHLARECERDERPLSAAARLGADLAVQGTLEAGSETLRIRVRLIDLTSERQIWTDRFSGKFQDVFELQDRIASQIAETLRVELITRAQLKPPSSEALDLYFRARRKLSLLKLFNDDGAIDLFSRCMKIAPDFSAAKAGYAMACLRGWHLAVDRSTGDWDRQARKATELALKEAGELPESNLAGAIFYAEQGRYREAKVQLKKALSLAPAYAEAMGMLGCLNLQVGLTEEGVEQVRSSLELNPELTGYAAVLIVYYAMHDERGKLEGIFEMLRAHGLEDHPVIVQAAFRVASWRKDAQAIETAVKRLPSEANSPAGVLVNFHGAVLAGRISADDAHQRVQSITKNAINPRWVTALHQLATEAFCLRDRPDLALLHLSGASDQNLIDIVWLDCSPALKSLRATPEFEKIRQVVRARADNVLYA